MRAFVIAMEAEADCVRPFLKDGDRLYVSGIGKVNAAMAAQQAVGDGATELVNCGLVGGFDPAMEVGDAYEVSRAAQYDFVLSEINGTPIGQLDERDTPFFDLVVSGRYPARVLATGDRFTEKIDDTPTLRALGATLRDMEGAAIAQVAERRGVPLRALKVISDVHGKEEMTKQYAVNRERALQCLKNALSSWI